MQRVIITGANGSGKSTLATRLQTARPDVPLCRFDSFKLTTEWQTRPRAAIDRDLAQQVAAPAWIIEGGPSVLPLALPRADLAISLDPPLPVRAWRLFARPVRHAGRTRPELPAGNRDQIAAGWRFAWRSLRRDRQSFNTVQNTVTGAPCPVVHCPTRVDVESAVKLWAGAAL
ncbi:DNA topology modulation protein FlaR [Pseudooctadecabacter sp.]|uniref:DNA topology modulation protein FlaR n=1 Tax=Pseudooctadecabacter sp. TaxID=1966338 RepID=UPI0035C8048D